MIKIILFLFSIIEIVDATSVNKLVNLSLRNNHSLKAIKHKISAQNIQIKKSQILQNPNLAMTLSDIQFNNPFSRTLEPMQTNSISIKQQFISKSKLKAFKRFELSTKRVILNSLQIAKVELAKRVRLSAYTIKEIEDRISILYRYKKLIKQNIELYTSYASTDNKSHLSSMSSSLILSKIKIEIERLKSILNIQKSSLRYLVGKKINTISINDRIKRLNSLKYYLKKSYNNKTYRQKLSKLKRAKANKKIADLSINPDPYVKVGYYNRPNYADYTTVSIGLSLPIYGREKLNSQIAKRAILESTSSRLDYILIVKSEIRAEYSRLKEAYKIYNIIKNDSLKELAHMFELSQSNIQNGGDFFVYTSLLEQKLTLEEQLISVKAQYFRSKVKLNSLIGKR